MPLALLHIYRLTREVEIFQRLQSEFADRGWDIIIWTNWDIGSPGVASIPIVRNRNHTEWLSSNWAQRDNRLSSEAERNISSLMENLQGNYAKVESDSEVELLKKTSSFIFTQLKPDVYLNWCGMNPLFYIPKAVAIECGVRCLTWEAGLLPGTFLLDERGLMADATYAKKSFPVSDLTGPDLRCTSFDSYLDSQIKSLKTKVEGSSSLRYRREPEFSKILVLGGMDFANGVHRASGETTTLGRLESGSKIARILSNEFGDEALVLYRPHPREPRDVSVDFKGSSVVVDSSSDIHAQYKWADVVVGYGSKTDIDVLLLGKPLVVAGNTIFAGKGIGEEGIDEVSLKNAVEKSIKQGVTVDQKGAIRKFLYFLYETQCYPRVEGAQCKPTIADFVDKVIGYQSVDGGLKLTSESLLSPDGKLKWEKMEEEREVLERQKNSHYSLEETLKNPNFLRVVLDFDLTLFKANTTELFIAKACPNVLSQYAAKCGELVYRVCGKLNSKCYAYRDYFRLWAVILLMPWSLLLWRLQAKRLAELYLDTEMYAAAKQGGREVVVVSCGFDWLIKPVLKHLDPSIVLVSSNLAKVTKDVRALTKLGLVRALWKDFDGEQVCSVSDSLEDADLLSATHGCLIEAQDEAKLKVAPLYRPLRYTAEAKYNWRWTLQQVLGKDLLIVILAFATSWQSAVAVALLYFSLMCIYEIGYYENDFKAAQKENSPTLKDKYHRFEGYAIYSGAWFSAVVGVVIASVVVGVWNDWSYWALWIGALVVLQLFFRFYNSSSEKGRMYLYPILQLFKFMAYGCVLSMSPAGVILISSSMTMMVIKYLIYRCGGDKMLLSVPKMTLIITFCYFIISFIANGRAWEFVDYIVLVLGVGVQLLDSVIQFAMRKLRGRAV